MLLMNKDSSIVYCKTEGSELVGIATNDSLRILSTGQIPLDVKEQAKAALGGWEELGFKRHLVFAQPVHRRVELRTIIFTLLSPERTSLARVRITQGRTGIQSVRHSITSHEKNAEPLIWETQCHYEKPPEFLWERHQEKLTNRVLRRLDGTAEECLLAEQRYVGKLLDSAVASQWLQEVPDHDFEQFQIQMRRKGRMESLCVSSLVCALVLFLARKIPGAYELCLAAGAIALGFGAWFFYLVESRWLWARDMCGALALIAVCLFAMAPDFFLTLFFV